MDSNVRHQYAASIARQSGFTHGVVSNDLFVITTYQKQSPSGHDLLVVYIEGDGQAWLRKGRLSVDPTPKTPVALQLAVQDPHPAVAYIARPCQYLDTDALKQCNPEYWSTARYSETVIAALNETISEIAVGYKRISLVGYSGGGVVATLVAARRNDIAWLVTIAANLDHTYWTTLHNVTPLSGSLNAADYAESIQTLPQLHLVGEKDTIVPITVTQSYLDKTTDTGNIQVKTIPGFDHQCCWADIWPKPLCESGKLDIGYCGK